MLPTRTGRGLGAALGSDPEPCEAENQHKLGKSGRKGKRPNCDKLRQQMWQRMKHLQKESKGIERNQRQPTWELRPWQLGKDIGDQHVQELQMTGAGRQDMKHSGHFRSSRHVQSHPMRIRLECLPFDSMESILQAVLVLPVELATSEAYESWVCWKHWTELHLLPTFCFFFNSDLAVPYSCTRLYHWVNKVFQTCTWPEHVCIMHLSALSCSVQLVLSFSHTLLWPSALKPPCLVSTKSPQPNLSKWRWWTVTIQLFLQRQKRESKKLTLLMKMPKKVFKPKFLNRWKEKQFEKAPTALTWERASLSNDVGRKQI